MSDYLPQQGLFPREQHRQGTLTGRGQISDADRYRQLSKLDKRTLASIHADNGGLMGLSVYLKWTKDELIAAILEDEQPPAPAPLPLDGCTCGGIGNTGSHRGDCPWRM